MSTNLTAIADLQAGFADLSAELAGMKATQPNLDYFVQEMGKLLLKFEQSVREDFRVLEDDLTHNFKDKFAGNFFSFTEAMTARVVNLEEKQSKLEEMLGDHLNKYDEKLKEHKAKISSLYKSHVEAIEKLLAKNKETLEAQQAAVNQTLVAAQGFDQHFVDLHNGHFNLLKASEETIAKVEDAVKRFDEISTGTLKEVAKEAQQAIKQMHDDAQNHIVRTRRRFIKVISGFDDKLSQFPVLFLVMVIAMISFFFGLGGNILGRKIVKDNAQEMITESVTKAQDAINERIDPKIEELQKLEHSLSMTFDDAQMWDALTANMTYEEKLAYIKKAQAEIQRRGQTMRSKRE